MDHSARPAARRVIDRRQPERPSALCEGGTAHAACASRATKPLTLLLAFGFLTSSNLSTTMANTKSAIKAARKTVRLTERNRGVKTRLKTLRKRLDTLIAAKDDAATKTAAAEYVSAMDKAVKSGVVHKNAASRAKAHAAKVFAKK
jgi:small subunit ribosomal protein S20